MSGAGETRLDRRHVVARLLRDRGEAVVVSGLGSPSWDVAAPGDHPRNVYLWGAMGGCVSMALGLALAKPDVPVLAVTGDGEMMMGVGSLAVVAQQAPANLAIVTLDNGEYGETGAQRAHTAPNAPHRADLEALARASGLRAARTVTTEAELEALAAEIPTLTAGPVFVSVTVAPGPAARGAIANALRDIAHGRARTRLALGLKAE
jgi:thiamine pyrophosphate-dependent acetolactate synthase large subunit-like protein